MKQYSPSSERNRQPILGVLRQYLPKEGLMLEIASGTGMHAVHIAKAFPRLRYQPSDTSPTALSSIKAWAEEAALPNLLPPVALDVRDIPWPLEEASVIYNANMIHISPWETAVALMEEAGRLLNPGGHLCLYGPFIEADVPTAPSNSAFDRSLKSRDPRWGIRALDEVLALAAENGLHLEARHGMPANNLMVIFTRG